MEFRILKKSKQSRARMGFLKTSHGVVATPCLVPVATQAVVKTLTSEEADLTKSQILIANTFHLHLRPGEETIKKAGGLHKFMNWQAPLMTDSGGYQVFSLGFGKDFGVGKILSEKNSQFFTSIEVKDQPQELKITQEGVYFRLPTSGEKLFLGPKESIRIQEKLGADIILTFDECPPPMANMGYVKKSLQRTHNWAKICLREKKTKQALFGIVQGSRFKNLRVESAKFIGSLDFDGFGIGGEFGADKKKMTQILSWVVEQLPEKKPRHLLGIGKLEDIENIIKAGIDLFDCTVPTHYARRGIAYISSEILDLNQSKFLKDNNPLDKRCNCFICQNYKRNYICHLLRAKEITGLKLLTFHNLYFFNSVIENIRKKIKEGKI